MTILDIRNVSKNYGKNQALRRISIEIPKQSIFGLLGPNGAGKTTLIRIVNQILASDEGEIFLNGEKLSGKHIQHIGYLPEERGLYKKMKVGEQLLYFAQLKGLSKTEAVRNIRNWMERLDALDWLPRKVEDLSKGMQQKIQFIGTVLHGPDLLILDEPFSGFDPINANLIKEEILNLRENGTTVIVSTHRMESVEELCENIALIHKAEKILDGPKNEIKERYKKEIFIIEHVGNISNLNDRFEILSNENHENDLWISKIKLGKETTPNQLLQMLVEKTEVCSFRQEVPNMNEIFIMAVNGGDHA